MTAQLPGQIEQFLTYLRDVRQLSPHTLSNYGRDLASLLDWCLQQEISDAAEVSTGDIRQYASQLHRRGLAGSSIQRNLSAIRSFYNHLGRQRKDGINHNPANGIQAPKQARRLPKTLDVDQLSRFLQPQSDDPLELRDLAMAELFYSSGLRLSELASLNLNDIDPRSALVTVIGKGSKARTVPVGSVALEAIASWREQRIAPASEFALFTSNRGQRISLRNIQARLKKLGRKSGMPQDIHPHMLRHSFASHMLESSGDLRAVQELLGHANISTTQIYTHLDFQHLAKVYDKAHPRSKRRAHSHDKDDK